jgi:hypothetical protein
MMMNQNISFATATLKQSSKNQDITEIDEQLILLKEQKQTVLLNQAANDNLKQRM